MGPWHKLKGVRWKDIPTRQAEVRITNLGLLGSILHSAKQSRNEVSPPSNGGQHISYSCPEKKPGLEDWEGSMPGTRPAMLQAWASRALFPIRSPYMGSVSENSFIFNYVLVCFSWSPPNLPFTLPPNRILLKTQYNETLKAVLVNQIGQAPDLPA